LTIVTPLGRTLTTCVFDLDETMYPRGAGVMAQVGVLIKRYMLERLNVPADEVDALRLRLFQAYGTALRGLMAEGYAIDPEDYLAYVHQVDVEGLVRPSPELDAALAALPLDKVIFTNATRQHAVRVLDRLGVRRHFGCIVDLRDIDYLCKPDPHAYARLLACSGRTAGEMVLVEDAPRNLRPAAALGMVTVLVDALDDVDCHAFDFCIPDVLDIGRVAAALQAAK
jgi:putative hydrolase of the HAD superfamily